VKTLLDAGCEVFICTSPKLANPSCASDKLDWVTRHIPSLRRNVIVTKDKTLVQGHLLIDDKPDITGVITPSWQHVMFSTPGNASSVPVSGLRLPSWEDAEWLAEHAHLLASGRIRS
jgi:5'-nucleotidase